MQCQRIKASVYKYNACMKRRVVSFQKQILFLVFIFFSASECLNVWMEGKKTLFWNLNRPSICADHHLVSFYSVRQPVSFLYLQIGLRLRASQYNAYNTNTLSSRLLAQKPQIRAGALLFHILLFHILLHQIVHARWQCIILFEFPRSIPAGADDLVLSSYILYIYFQVPSIQ